MAALNLKQENNKVTIEIGNMMQCLTNENVKGNEDRQLDVWCRIFSRVLRPDGKRLLCSHDKMRFNMKTRAHDALEYLDHPIEELAKKVNNFIEQIEYWGIGPADIVEEQL